MYYALRKIKLQIKAFREKNWSVKLIIVDIKVNFRKNERLPERLTITRKK